MKSKQKTFKTQLKYAKKTVFVCIVGIFLGMNACYSFKHLTQAKGKSTLDTFDLNSSTSQTTFLLGIFSTYNETAFRNLIRTRMLKESLPPQIQQRVCSLHEFLTSNFVERTCQIIYTFVIGGNNSASKVLDPKQSILINNSHSSSPEDDLTILNIHENMNQGKTPSWFYYVSTIQTSNIDYVSKLDSDTFLSIPCLLDFIQNRLPNSTHPSFLYGGVKLDYLACGGRAGRKRRCSPIKGKMYMAGQFYFISRSIVQMNHLWISRQLAMDEDVDFALRLWTSNATTISTIFFNDDKFWMHELKRLENYSQYADEVANISWIIHNTGK
jgi:hypothetical protein